VVNGRSGLRGWLVAAVAVAILGGLVLISAPRSEPAAPPASGPGQGAPQGAVTPPVPTRSSTTKADPGRAEAVSALLRRRANAVNRRDERAFLAGIDPTAAPEFVSSQRALFANLAGVPLDEWSYVVRADDSGDTATLPRSPGTDELWAPAVDLRYSLRGVDSVPTARTMSYLFARRGGSWYLRSDTALDDAGRRTWRGPWDFGACTVTTTGSGLVLFHPGDEAMADRLARELDAAVAAVSAVWGTAWSQRVALLVPASLDEMRALVGPGFPIESVVGVSVADRVDADRHAVAGQRVVLSPTGSRVLSVAALRVVLRHEITHVAARADTVDGSPMWLLEGFADYVGYRDSGIALPQGAPDLADLVKRSGPPQSLPEDKDFHAQGRELNLAYQESWSVARFVAERRGEDTLISLYRKLAGAGSGSASQTDELLRQVLGMDRAGLVAGWRQYLVDTLK
jgi:hypothetical protein